MLFSDDKDGVTRSYLISYNEKKDEKMTVWINGAVNTDYKDQRKLTPMEDMIQALTLSKSYLQRKVGFTLTYSGYQKKALGYDWYYVDTAGELQPYPSDNYGMDIDGYMMSLERKGEDPVVILIGEGTSQTVEKLRAEEERRKISEQAREKNGILVKEEGDNMTFYLNESVSMKLTVTDAALGSRFYCFDGEGVHNDDPFDGNTGVAEGIYFLNERSGFILLSGASSDDSVMYYTKDGGEHFTKVSLPLQDVGESFEGLSTDYTIEDMDYIGIPYQENGKLYVKVGPNAAELDYLNLCFESENGGEIWKPLKN